MILVPTLKEFRSQIAKRAAALTVAAHATLRQPSAHLWMWGYRARERLISATVRRAPLLIGIIAVSLLAVLMLYTPQLQTVLIGYFPSSGSIDGLRNVLLTVGGAMIGATALVFTLIMFAMQVNVERMPHGLFRKFSSDLGLLATFLASSVCALWIALSPLVLRTETVAITLMSAASAALLIFALFLVAYRRALRLINPAEQLRIVVRTAQRDMNRWRRIAERTRALFEGDEPERDESLGPGNDLALTKFFLRHGDWTAYAERSLSYAVAFSRRFAEQGDHEVADVALNSILAINATYVRVKGRTFFAQTLMLDNPLVTDGLINATLEHLRQNVQIARGRRDERAISQNARALAELAKIYLTIDYGGEHHTKTHALIASRYLSDAILSVAPNNLPDRLMEGAQLLGITANAFLAKRQFTDLSAFGNYIATIGAIGTARTDHKPVLQTAIDELAKITFNLIRTKAGNVRFALQDIKSNVSILTQLSLTTPDGRFGSGHSFDLAPYYSSTTDQCLLSWLQDLTNAVLGANENDEAAAKVLANLELFSDGLYRTEKEIMLASIKQKSSFTFDIIHWISSVSILLWAASTADACDDGTAEKLRSHGLWLASVLSWIPAEAEAIDIVERYRLADTLFNLSFEAHSRVGGHIADSVNDLQLSWAIKAAAHGAGWWSLAQSMSGLAVMATQRDDSGRMLDALRKALADAEIKPDQEVLDYAARELRQRSERLWEVNHTLSHIESAMAAADGSKLEPILKAVADVLSPSTSGKTIDHYA